jgi:hypothetical protein
MSAEGPLLLTLLASFLTVNFTWIALKIYKAKNRKKMLKDINI